MAPVPIYVSNGQGYVWTVDDIATLRTEHHITGSLIGTLPSATQQNVFLGLPLLLMPEEVVLLVEEGLACLVDDPHSYPPPTPAQLVEWEAARQTDIQRQLALREEKEAKPKPLMTAEAIKKREEREARRRAEQEARRAAALEAGELLDEEEQEPEGESPKPRPEGTQTPAKPPKDPSYWSTTPTSSSSLPWYTPAPHTYPSLPLARATGLWSYPSTRQEKAKCAVFKSLWKQGFFMGPGLKFGGDWLVYPGDMLRYHSHFVATAYVFGGGEGVGREGAGEGKEDDGRRTLRPMEIIAFGRLGTATKKAHLLCGWDESKGEVRYFSVEWANFG